MTGTGRSGRVGRQTRFPNDQDRELIGRLLAGESDAEDAFVSRFRGLAIGLARGRFGLDPLAANEVWQEVVVRLWSDDHKALRSWRGEGRFSTYLTVIVTHVCIRLGTEQSRREATSESLDAASRVADGAPNPSQDAARRERQQVLGNALAEMSPRDQLLLALRFQDGHRATEIAQLLNLSPGAVRKALHDARKRLRKHLLGSHPDLFSAATGNATPLERSNTLGDSHPSGDRLPTGDSK